MGLKPTDPGPTLQPRTARGPAVTRYITLAREPARERPAEAAGAREYKTSLVFALASGPGQLFKALSAFALRDIDMTKIESRPMKGVPILSSSDGLAQFNYLFYVDVLANESDRRAQNALRHLKEVAPFVKILGSYPTNIEGAAFATAQ